MGLMTLATLTHPPAEDAVILHQYSRNLAKTGVISYIPGGAPAEGATDFLWMLYIALGLTLHLSPIISTAIANLLCGLGLSYVLLRLAKRTFHWIPALAVFGALVLMPQSLAAAAGFSVLPFALLIATTVMFSFEGRDAQTAVSALLLCLLRPDGVVFAVPIIVSRLVTFPKIRAFSRYLLIFILPGCAYFIWRWQYFQHFLPLPFLVKSDTDRVFGIFAPTAHTLVRYLIFATIILIGGLGKRLLQRQSISLIVVTLVAPSLFYSAMRLDQNVFYRFYFFVPLVVAVIIAMYWDSLAWDPTVLFTVTFLAFTLCLAKVDFLSIESYRAETAYWRRNEHIAKQMNVMSGRLLTSEAGEFAYYSGWKTYDGWGLNTPEYATHLIRPEEVAALAPDVVSIKSEECAPVISPVRTDRTFDNLFRNIKTAMAWAGTYEVWQVAANAKEPTVKVCWYIHKGYSGQNRMESILADSGGSQLAK
jgi:hypothetical protein